MTMIETSQAAQAAPTAPPYSTAEMRSYPHGPIRLVTAARSDIKDAIENIHEPKGLITQMALAEARGETLPPQPAPTSTPVYRVEVTLSSGATILVAEASDFEYAKSIGMRV